MFRIRLATLTITNCTVSGNSGGGISNIGTGAFETSFPAELTVSNCTISGNSAFNGGGIYNEASGAGCLGCKLFWPGSAMVAISNSTLSGNSATGDGGAIYNNAGPFGGATVSVKSSTISGNSATGHGGGIYNNNAGGSAELELGSTILNAGSLGENIFNNVGRVTLLGITSPPITGAVS